MTALDQFVPFVLPYVNGVGDPAMLKAIRDTCIDFCAQTDLVQRVLAQDITATVQDYTPAAPAQMQVVRVLAVMWQGVWFDVVAPDQVMSDVALRGVTIGTAIPLTGSPRCFFQKTPASAAVSLYPIPDTTLVNGLTIKASFTPTNAADSVEDVLYTDYPDTIGQGAAARLMMVPGQTYSSASSAVAFAMAYQRGLSTAKIQKYMGTAMHNLRVRPVRFV